MNKAAEYIQPDRSPEDGPISVCRLPHGNIGIDVSHDGNLHSIVCTEYNAVRAFAALSLILGIPLPRGLKITM